MLSIGRLDASRADYYVDQVQAGRDEYYISDQAEPGYWVGKASELLGLRGEVSAEAFRRVLDGQHPASGEALVRARADKRVAGFDLCFSAPKSVSVTWALASPALAADIARSHDRAVAQAIGAIEAEVVRARRGAGGRELVETQGLVGAAFAHRSSRAGDPQLHTHVVVAQITPDAEGRWSAPWGKRFYHWSKTVGYLYQAALRRELHDIGFGFTQAHNGAAEIAGVPRHVVEAFSTRRAELSAAMEQAGTSSARAAQVATLATRAPKSSVPGLSELRQDWLARAVSLGLSEGFSISLADAPKVPPPRLDDLAAELLGPRGLTANASAFERRSLLQSLAAAHGAGADVGELRRLADRVLGRQEVVTLTQNWLGDGRYSTAELVALEADVLMRAARMQDAGRPPVPPAALGAALAARPSLSDEQRAMVSTLTTSPSGVMVVVGRAGAGKTFALDTARSAWEAAGRTVIGTALAARAAAELQAGAGIPSVTVDRLLADLDRPGPLAGLVPGTVVVVDEAGMLGTRKLARLAAHAEHYRAALVLVGDPRQLPEVEAGGAFAKLAGRLPTIELADNRRQAQAWERTALAELRSGPLASALGAYEQAGRIVVRAQADELRDAMVDAWWASVRSGEDAMMYALRRSDVDDLNARARSRMQAAGALGPEVLEVNGRQFALGDRVMCLRNDRRLGVRNGTVSIVVELDQASRALALSDGARLPSAYLEAGHLGHAYASTVHKAQGATVDRAFLLGSDQLYREAGYVGMSRGRLSNHLFVVASAPDRHLDEIRKALGTSRAQSLALDQLPQRASGATSPAALLADPPAWATEALGQAPLAGAARRRWAQRAALVEDYRRSNGLEGVARTGPGALALGVLGPEPRDPLQRRGWQLARMAIADHDRALGQAERGMEL